MQSAAAGAEHSEARQCMTALYVCCCTDVADECSWLAPDAAAASDANGTGQHGRGTSAAERSEPGSDSDWELAQVSC